MSSRCLNRATLVLVLLALAVGCSEDEPSCKAIASDAKALIESNQSCTTHADCVSGPSFDCFWQCGSIVNRDTDLEDVRAQGRGLDDEYKDRGCACPMPECADPQQFRFECVDNACTSVINAR